MFNLTLEPVTSSITSLLIINPFPPRQRSFILESCVVLAVVISRGAIVPRRNASILSVITLKEAPLALTFFVLPVT